MVFSSFSSLSIKAKGLIVVICVVTTAHLHGRVLVLPDSSDEAAALLLEEHDDSPTITTRPRTSIISNEAVSPSTIASRSTSPRQTTGNSDTIVAKVTSPSTNTTSAAKGVINISIDPQALDQMLTAILKKWTVENANNLTNTNTAAQDKNDNDAMLLQTLRRIWQKDNSYHPLNHMLVFFHPLKSGGTSVSDVLQSMGGVVPGSYRSSKFDFHKLREEQAMAMHQHEGLRTGNFSSTQWWNQFRVLYSHGPYRSYNSSYSETNGNVSASNLQKTTGVYNILHRNIQDKRIRHLTMIREPLALVASNWHEWFCRISKWTGAAQAQKLPPIPQDVPYNGCHGYSLTELAQARMHSNKQKCENKTESDLKQMKKERRRMCNKLNEKDGWEDRPQCASMPVFLNSRLYNEFFHNHGVYARCTVATSGTTPSRHYFQAALEFLGGIDVDNGDMMWAGVTERMHESMCLLHYQLQLPWVETPRARVQNCRPTNFWSEMDRQVFYQKEGMMIAVHRAANAVLDVQLSKMRHSVEQQLRELSGKFNHNRTAMLESLPHIKASCLEASSG